MKMIGSWAVIASVSIIACFAASEASAEQRNWFGPSGGRSMFWGNMFAPQPMFYPPPRQRYWRGAVAPGGASRFPAEGEGDANGTDAEERTPHHRRPVGRDCGNSGDRWGARHLRAGSGHRRRIWFHRDPAADLRRPDLRLQRHPRRQAFPHQDRGGGWRARRSQEAMIRLRRSND